MIPLVACGMNTSRKKDDVNYEGADSSTDETVNGGNEGSTGEAVAIKAAYITIDINPSVELIVEDEIVVSVRAINDDAAILLSGESLEGLSIDEATEKIVALAEELGYLNEENTDVNVTVTADDDELTVELERKAEDGIKKGSEIAEIKKNPRSKDIEAVKELKAKNPELYKDLTPAILRIVDEIIELNSEITYEECMDMKVSELVEMLKSLASQAEQAIPSDLKEEMKKRHKEMKEEIKREMAGIYGEEYLDKWDKHHALEELFDKFEEKSKEIAISEEDVLAIMELLNIEDITEITENEKITPELIFEYIEELEEKVSEEIELQIEAILEKYKKENYELTEEEHKEIEEIFGERVEISGIEELEGFIESNEEALDKFKEEIELTPEDEEQLDSFKDRFNDLKEQLDEEFEEKIQEAKDELNRLKEEKRKENNHKKP